MKTLFWQLKFEVKQLQYKSLHPRPIWQIITLTYSLCSLAMLPSILATFLSASVFLDPILSASRLPFAERNTAYLYISPNCITLEPHTPTSSGTTQTSYRTLKNRSSQFINNANHYVEYAGKTTKLTTPFKLTVVIPINARKAASGYWPRVTAAQALSLGQWQCELFRGVLPARCEWREVQQLSEWKQTVCTESKHQWYISLGIKACRLQHTNSFSLCTLSVRLKAN